MIVYKAGFLQDVPAYVVKLVFGDACPLSDLEMAEPWQHPSAHIWAEMKEEEIDVWSLRMCSSCETVDWQKQNLIEECETRERNHVKMLAAEHIIDNEGLYEVISSKMRESEWLRRMGWVKRTRERLSEFGELGVRNELRPESTNAVTDLIEKIGSLKPGLIEKIGFPELSGSASFARTTRRSPVIDLEVLEPGQDSFSHSQEAQVAELALAPTPAPSPYHCPSELARSAAAQLRPQRFTMIVLEVGRVNGWFRLINRSHSPHDD